MDVVILGSQPAYAGPGRACSGYLVRKGKSRLLLDIGTGVLSNFLRWADPAELDGLVITHLHPDHFLDIYPLRFYLQLECERKEPLPVFAPQGAEDFITQLVGPDSRADFSRLFAFHTVADGAREAIGPFEVLFRLMKHSVPTFGVVVDGKRLVYTSDCDFDNALLALAKGARLLLSEATLQEPIFPGHLDGEQAGQVAKA
ncbi:MAG: MBL fold metallo-hydrolase, partial [Terriglobia bacterium]